MVVSKNRRILLWLFITNFFILARSSALSFQLVEQKEITYNSIPISIKIMTDKSTIEQYPDLLKYSEGSSRLISLESDLVIDDYSDCMYLTMFEPFNSSTSVISLQIIDKNFITLSKCQRENNNAYTINIGKDKAYLS